MTQKVVVIGGVATGPKAAARLRFRSAIVQRSKACTANHHARLLSAEMP